MTPFRTSGSRKIHQPVSDGVENRGTQTASQGNCDKLPVRAHRILLVLRQLETLQSLIRYGQRV